MSKKKPLKVLLITFFCAIALIGLTTLTVIFIKSDNSKTQTDLAINTDKFFVAQVAIYNNNFSQNFNGTYKFKRVNFVKISSFNEDAQANIYAKYKVSDTMSLLSAMTKEKKQELETNNETLIIDNGIFQINHNFSPYQYGTIYGNDDYSILTDKNQGKIATVSLTNLSAEDLKNINSDEYVVYHGSELYFSQTKTIVYDGNTYSLDVVYVYDLVK